MPLTILFPVGYPAQRQRRTPPCCRGGPCLRGPCVYVFPCVYVVLVYYVDFVVLVVVLLFCVPVVLIVSDVRDGRLAPACYRALLVDCTPPTQDGDRLLWHWGA